MDGGGPRREFWELLGKEVKCYFLRKKVVDAS